MGLLIWTCLVLHLFRRNVWPAEPLDTLPGSRVGGKAWWYAPLCGIANLLSPGPVSLQCRSLDALGISACFLGSAQPDSSVAEGAWAGRYMIIYMTPEFAISNIEHLAQLGMTPPVRSRFPCLWLFHLGKCC